MKNILSPNLAKCYHFVIILLSSRGFAAMVSNYATSYDMLKNERKSRS